MRKLTYGESNGQAKLTDADILAIRTSYSARELNQTELSKKYGVSGSTISRIVNNKRWNYGDAPSEKSAGLEKRVNDLNDRDFANSRNTKPVTTVKTGLVADATEHWKDVVGYEGLYAISSHGNIRRDGSCLKQHTGTNGYLFVGLSRESKATTVYLHVQVARHFIGARPQGFVINHVDGNKHNNDVHNLEYTTQLDNINKAIELGLHTPRNNGSAKIDLAKARDIREKYKTGSFKHKDLANEYGVARNTITQILNGYTWLE